MRDVNDNLLTGQAANLTKSLRTSAGAAAETVTITEQGSSGYYVWSFTPVSGGTPPESYYLWIQEPVGSRELRMTWVIQVYDALPAYGGATSALTTLAAVREALGLKAADTGDDAYLTNQIIRVSEFIKRWTRRALTQTTLTEYHDGKGRDSLRLRDWPVISITSIHEDPDQSWVASTAVGASDYLLDARMGYVIKKGRLPWLRYEQSIRAIYVAGYATIPADLEMACIELVIAKWRRRRSEGLASKSQGDGSVVFFSPNDMTTDIRRILGLYMNMRCAA